VSRATELFGGRVREHRRRRKLTQERVAERIGCSQGHLDTDLASAVFKGAPYKYRGLLRKCARGLETLPVWLS
jgi:transcriptional regulator with XRE-family HTH domain